MSTLTKITVKRIESGLYETNQSINGITYIIEKTFNGQVWCWSSYDKANPMEGNEMHATLADAKYTIARCAELNGWKIN